MSFHLDHALRYSRRFSPRHTQIEFTHLAAPVSEQWECDRIQQYTVLLTFALVV